MVGALAASDEIYAMGMGVDVKDLGEIWMHAIDHPIAPEFIDTAPCHDVVIHTDGNTQGWYSPGRRQVWQLHIDPHRDTRCQRENPN